MKLNGLKVLVTRPRDQQQGFVDLLQRAGARADSYPVLEIAPIDPDGEPALAQQARQQWLALDKNQHILFVSTNAVRYGMAAIDQYWPQLPKGIQWYAIGQSTADALQQWPIDCQTETRAMNSEALLALPALQHVAGDKVLIVRGVGGREYLAEQLRARGARVSYAECYRRQLPQRPAGELAELLQRQAYQLVCVHSGESLSNLLALLDKDISVLQQSSLLVPGQRVAELARQQGLKKIVVADNASSAAMLAALQQAELAVSMDR
jgi:uroporphyrinogen-III synthase